MMCHQHVTHSSHPALRGLCALCHCKEHGWASIVAHDCCMIAALLSHAVIPAVMLYLSISNFMSSKADLQGASCSVMNCVHFQRAPNQHCFPANSRGSEVHANCAAVVGNLQDGAISTVSHGGCLEICDTHKSTLLEILISAELLCTSVVVLFDATGNFEAAMVDVILQCDIQDLFVYRMPMSWCA